MSWRDGASVVDEGVVSVVGGSSEEADCSVGSTRCRDISSSNEGDKMHATRARWRVEDDAEAPTNGVVVFTGVVVAVKPTAYAGAVGVV